MDPSMLYAPAARIEDEVAHILAGFGGAKAMSLTLATASIRDVDPQHAGVFVEAVHRLSAQYHQ